MIDPSLDYFPFPQGKIVLHEEWNRRTFDLARQHMGYGAYLFFLCIGTPLSYVQGMLISAFSPDILKGLLRDKNAKIYVTGLCARDLDAAMWMSRFDAGRKGRIACHLAFMESADYAALLTAGELEPVYQNKEV